MSAAPDTLDALSRSGALDTLPSIVHAKLPAVYESARTALSECSRIDECQQWADKTEALASYAKQAGDDSLRKFADRIQARAIRRCGELLRAIPASKGGRPSAENPSAEEWAARRGAYVTVIPPETHTAADTSLTRTQAATDAGLSKRQKDTALRVAAVPAEEFEQQVESASPPTVTQLAEQGRKPREVKPVIDLGGRSPEDFAAATQAIGCLHSLAQFCAAHDAARVAAGVMPFDLAGLRKSLATIEQWLDVFVIRLTKE